MSTDGTQPLSPEEARERLVQSWKSLVRDTEEVLRATAGQVGDKAGEARAKLEATLKDAKERLAVAEAVVVDRTKEYAEATNAFVRENPWRAVTVAGGVGFLLGLLCGRR